MNWIRKTIFFVSFLIIAFFAMQANETAIQKIETQKTDTNFSIELNDSLAFIQPQASYQLAANVKTNYPAVIKWFDTLLIIIPSHRVIKSVSNFANQYSLQSKNVFLLLYPFHYFW
ncbi:hypothetical protein AR687_17580 [Flavobacteriaceae bacterium CRH]|nr:hypothetical protein AR687_17580 [Flavobacteriaceae bacterium CRH]